jgi:hypothetical protein
MVVRRPETVIFERFGTVIRAILLTANRPVPALAGTAASMV